MKEIDELKKWLDDHMIEGKIIRDVVTISGFGRCLFQDMSKREHLFKQNKDTGDFEFDCVEVPKYLISDDIFYVIVKFGNEFYYTDVRKDFKLNPLRHVGDRKEHEESYKHPYVNLGVHTPYELLNGSGPITEWVKTAKWMGHRSIGICDRNTMAATLQLQKEAKAAGIGYVFGYSLTMCFGADVEVGAKIYVSTKRGFRNLLRIQKAINVDREDGKIDYLEVLNRADGNVIVFDKWSGDWMAQNTNLLRDFCDAFGGWVFFQVDMSEYRADRIDSMLLDSQKAYFDTFYNNGKWKLGIEPVLIEDCYYIDSDEWMNKVILNKIDTGVTHELSDQQYYKDTTQLYDEFCALFSEKYPDEVFDLMCQNTVIIAGESDAAYDFTCNFMPQYRMTEEEKDKYGDTHNMFLQLCYEGLKKITPPGMEKEYRKRLEYEIEVLEQTDSVDYMLIQFDTINWCRKNGVAYGTGRGSAAGALVLRCLNVTMVDSIRFKLIFERFLVPERAGLSPGDVTIIGNDVETNEYYEVELESGKKIRVPADSEFMVIRDGSEVKVPVSELTADDDIRFDQRDLTFTLNEI